MLVLIHSHDFYPSVGGIQTFSDLLARGLVGLGFRVRVAGGTPLGDAPPLERPYETAYLGARRAAGRVLGGVRALVSVGPSIRLVGAAHARGIPCILVHQGPHGACPAAIGWRDGRTCSVGIRRCLSCTVCGQKRADNLKYLARFAALRWAMSGAAHNVFVSHDLARRVAAQRRTVIWNTFDPEVFHPSRASATRDDAPLFTFVGRLVNLKGIAVALRAFALVQKRRRDARLRIVGEGPLLGESRRLAGALGVAHAVRFLPFQTPARLAEIYRESWATLFPSQWAEPFGIVMIESMACGCPVIASDHGAPPEILRDTGLLLPAHDHAAWAAAMLELASDPARRARLGAAAALRAHRHFPLAAIARRYATLLESAAGRRAA